MLPIKFRLNPTYGLGGVVVWRISRCSPCGHLGYRNGTILAILNLYVTVMPPIKFLLNSTYGLGEDIVWRISRWRHSGHLRYRNGTILGILHLYAPPMPPIMFRLNLTYGLVGDIVWRISRWAPWRPSWISERNDFSNSESLCHCDIRCLPLSFGSIYHYGLGDVVWRILWRPPWVWDDFSNSIKFRFNPTYGWEEMSFE